MRVFPLVSTVFCPRVPPKPNTAALNYFFFTFYLFLSCDHTKHKLKIDCIGPNIGQPWLRVDFKRRPLSDDRLWPSSIFSSSVRAMILVCVTDFLPGSFLHWKTLGEVMNLGWVFFSFRLKILGWLFTWEVIWYGLVFIFTDTFNWNNCETWAKVTNVSCGEI